MAKRKSDQYWKKRFTDLENASNAYGQKTFREIEPAFDKAQRQIQAQIENWYQRYADNNGITIQDARKQLSAKELKELKWDVNEYIKHGRENGINQSWMKELENASARFHISRLEALKLRTQQALEVAFGNEYDAVDRMARKVFTDDYYHSIFEMQKGLGIGWQPGQINDRVLDKIVKKPWAADGKNFSDRIWERKQQMVGQLHQELTRTIIQGKAPDQAISHMEKYVDKSVKNAKHAASTLVMTEQAYFHSVSQEQAFKELDVEEFEVVATLDSHTSEICQEMDGKHFPMKDYEPGATAPPFHPNCRSVTVPYFDDVWSVGERAARNEEGKTYYVPADMTYLKWKESFVSGDPADQGLKAVDPNDKMKTEGQTSSGRDYTTSMAVKFGKDHYDGMHDLIDACPDKKAVGVWNKYEASITVSDPKYKKRAHCTAANIYLDGEKDAKGSSWESPFQVTFHESGHAIDHLAGKTIPGIGHFSAKYKDGVFYKTIKDEVERLVQAKGEIIKKAFKDHKGDWEWLAEHDYISTTSYHWFKTYGHWLGGEPKYSKSLAYAALEREIKELPSKAKADLSDILEGATNARISIGFGHGKTYWTQRNFAGVNDGLATEAFAEMTDSTFACPESLDAIKKYLPESYAVWQEMLEYILENL